MTNEPIGSKVNDARILSIIAYMTLIGWLIAYILNNPKTEQASFHIRQALGVNLLFLVSGVFFVVPIFGWIAGFLGYILGAILWVLGLIYAVQREQIEVPILGHNFQEWFQAV